MSDQKLTELVRQKLSVTKSPQERSDFVFNLIVAGHTEQDIIDSFYLNGVTKEESASYINSAKKRLDKFNRQSWRYQQQEILKSIDVKIFNFFRNIFRL